MLSDNDYATFIERAAQIVSKQFNVDLVVDHRIISEIKAHTAKSLDSFNQGAPNAAKQAANLAFWIRKLKPAFCERGYFSLANEYISLLCGIAAINAALKKDRKSVIVGQRPLTDFAHTLRFHSHSPHGLALSFDLFLSGSFKML